MSLLKWLTLGNEVLGSKRDGTTTNLSDMLLRSAVRWGYADKAGYWTDLGYRRATSTDYNRLGEAVRWLSKK